MSFVLCIYVMKTSSYPHPVCSFFVLFFVILLFYVFLLLTFLMQRTGTLDEIAAMACFMASKECSFTTGELSVAMESLFSMISNIFEEKK